ncbi:DUF1877 family protein [Actinacidiphila alni]|uniref:DUF1877 family protein n=1 Tax=Actinacidiphila alni TaxID=380248 RepID=UPI0033E5722F
MAVTQQLARVTAPYVAACRRAAGTDPDSDHGWDPPSADCLDLDWAPALLQCAAEAARLAPTHLAALVQATDGDDAPPCDLAFLNAHPHAIGPFGPVPTLLSAPAVARVSAHLDAIDFHAVLARLPADPRSASAVLGHGADRITGGPHAYLLRHFQALRAFYADAARRGLVVVLWWD